MSSFNTHPYEYKDMKSMEERNMTESEKIQYEELMATPIKELRRLAEKKGFDAHIFVEKSEIAKAIIRGTIL